MPQPVIIAVHQLGYGGVTNAVLDQAAMFRASGRPTTIATFTESTALRPRIEELRRNGRLHPDVDVVNLFEDASRRQTMLAGPAGSLLAGARRLGGRAHDRVRLQSEPGHDKAGSYVRYFGPGGDFLKLVRLTKDGAVASVDSFAERRRSTHDEYAAGRLFKRVSYDRETGTENQEQYFTPDGYCFMTRWKSPGTGRGQGVYVFDRRTRRARRFSGLPDWGVAWLEELARRQPAKPLIVAETPSVIPKVAQLPSEVAHRVGMLHNNQFAFPHEPGSAVRGDHVPILEALDSLDGLVVLTEQQRDDLVDLADHAERIYVVPNTAVVHDLPDVAPDDRLVTVVSRLAPQKALDEAVEAFALVLERVPDARLEIYGRGPEKGRLAALIAARGLGRSVLLKGRTEEPASVMARSVCTLSTSNWEAMPLSILESEALATPVVSYDCRYGPAALIEDGVTGRLVAKGDRAALADAVVELLHDPELARRMGAVARQRVQDAHTSDVVLGAWEKCFASITGRPGL
ncbi:glycosyltransferase [Cellulosimicrobium terreum]|nr:glycosyltransferase [Cellulosimicrobium terreum]